MKFLLSLYLIILPTLFLNAQVEFGATGSYWVYTNHSHNGGGQGWTMISVEGDTVVNNQTHKILRKTFWSVSGLPPDTLQGSSIMGTMLISNDSVFVNDKLILNFSMNVGDSMNVDFWNLDTYYSQLRVDSIETVEILGNNLKKWYGRKICHNPNGIFEYETFEIIEGIGQVGFEYLFWNIDGCIVGGGVRSLDCYKNGDFTFPPDSDCEQPLLTSNNEIINEPEIKIYPNPVSNVLNIESSKLVHKISIFDLTGKELYIKSINNTTERFDLSELPSGMYILQLTFNDSTLHLSKFIRH